MQDFLIYRCKINDGIHFPDTHTRARALANTQIRVHAYESCKATIILQVKKIADFVNAEFIETESCIPSYVYTTFSGTTF